MHKKIPLSILAFLTMFTLLPVHAENLETDLTKYPVIDRETANLTIRYFDDSEERIPITGAEFTVMKVADIGRDVTSGTNGGYIPLSEDINFLQLEETNDSQAYAYEEKVVQYYETNPENGYQETKSINADGEAKFELPVGAYLIRETKTTRYHVRSKPFLVSVPETNDTSDSWNYDVVVNPKQIIAGDLVVEKKILGKSSSADDIFHVQLSLNCSGEYKALLPDGSEGKVKDGDVIAIQGNQKLTVYDVPASSTYKVVEQEANIDPYKTGYENQTGTIQEKTEVKATIINDTTPWDNVHTGEGSLVIIAMMVGGGALALFIFLLLGRKKDRKGKK